jgi:hypothetical protein
LGLSKCNAKMSHSMDEGYLGVVVVYYERKGNILWNVRLNGLGLSKCIAKMTHVETSMD